MWKNNKSPPAWKRKRSNTHTVSCPWHFLPGGTLSWSWLGGRAGWGRDRVGWDRGYPVLVLAWGGWGQEQNRGTLFGPGQVGWRQGRDGVGWCGGTLSWSWPGAMRWGGGGAWAGGGELPCPGPGWCIHPPPPEQTHTCENITSRRMRAVKITRKTICDTEVDKRAQTTWTKPSTLLDNNQHFEKRNLLLRRNGTSRKSNFFGSCVPKSPKTNWHDSLHRIRDPQFAVWVPLVFATFHYFLAFLHCFHAKFLQRQIIHYFHGYFFPEISKRPPLDPVMYCWFEPSVSRLDGNTYLHHVEFPQPVSPDTVHSLNVKKNSVERIKIQK